jgi:hypothetical protein
MQLKLKSVMQESIYTKYRSIVQGYHVHCNQRCLGTVSILDTGTNTEYNIFRKSKVPVH